MALLPIVMPEGRITKVLEAHTVGGFLNVDQSLFDHPAEVTDLIRAGSHGQRFSDRGFFQTGKSPRLGKHQPWLPAALFSPFALFNSFFFTPTRRVRD
jgi:hypothetical protein